MHSTAHLYLQPTHQTAFKMATACEIQGHSDMYGLGIRIGFYLQWCASPIAAWVAPDETSGLRTANAFFVSATFLGLIIETVLNHLDITEIYIILMLTFGVQFIPLLVMLWRIVTRFDPNWDPTRFMKSPAPSKMFWFLYSLVQIAELIFQLWFWIYKIPRAEEECDRFGFAFFKVRLNGDGFRIFNIVFMAALLALVLLFFTLHLQYLWTQNKIPLLGNATVAPEVHAQISEDLQEYEPT
jgi:hypothetical protein